MSYLPRLVILLPLEQEGKIVFEADSLEDEYRLRGWLRRSAAMRALPDIVSRLLDDLDEFDERFEAA
jgi:hypothetical protein